MKNIKLIIATLVVLLFVSACAPTSNDGTQEDKTPAEKEPETPGEENTETSYYYDDFQVGVDAEEIYNKFMDAHEGLEVSEIELSLKNNFYVYEIEGFSGSEEFEAEYDAQTGDLIQLETDTYDGDKKPLIKDDLNFIKKYFDRSFEDVGEGYHLKEWTLKHKDKMKIMEIEIVNEMNEEIEYKYNVDSDELIEKDLD